MLRVTSLSFVFSNAKVMSLTISVPFDFINRDAFLQLYVEFPSGLWLEALFKIIVTYFWLSCGCLLSLFWFSVKEGGVGRPHTSAHANFTFDSLYAFGKNLPQWKKKNCCFYPIKAKRKKEGVSQRKLPVSQKGMQGCHHLTALCYYIQ